eukprot:3623765-Alexandrium_andersonii.AAC.1
MLADMPAPGLGRQAGESSARPAKPGLGEIARHGKYTSRRAGVSSRTNGGPPSVSAPDRAYRPTATRPPRGSSGAGTGSQGTS